MAGVAAGFDPQWGGFGPAPKFPRPAVFQFLLRYHARTGNGEALEMTLLTLREDRVAAITTYGLRDEIFVVDAGAKAPNFEAVTLFDSTGLAIQDLALCLGVLEAQRQGAVVPRSVDL